MSEEAIKSPTKKKLADTVTAIRLDRCFKVFELRKGGGSFRAISKILKEQDIAAGGKGRGFSHTQVKADYDFAIAVKTEDLGDIVTEARVLSAERLDDVHLKLSPLLNDPNPNVKVAAANALIRGVKEYAEIHGVKKLVVTGENGELLQPLADAVSAFEAKLIEVYGSDSEDS